MVKLNNNEVQNNNIDLPRTACSKFRFDIQESPESLRKQMRSGSSECYDFEDCADMDLENGPSYFLCDKYYKESYASVWDKKDEMYIETAMGNYLYSIAEKKNGGSSVEFQGPVNALLRQNLLPSMTYVPGTLQGKFYNKDSGEDYTGYMDMEAFGILRERKNQQIIHEGEIGYNVLSWHDYKGNPQDNSGHWINAHFNNEIPFFAHFREKGENEQECKNRMAQENFATGKMNKVAQWKKDRVKDSFQRIKGKISGAVIADETAESKISGKVKPMATPEIKAKIAAEIKKKEAAQK